MENNESFAPVIGCWYRDSSGAVFEVVAIDEDDRTIDIQYHDGSLEELDLDLWWETPLEAIDAPEDWSGPLDMERDDLDFGAADFPVDDWSTAIDFIERAE